MNRFVLLINPPGAKGLFRDTICSFSSKAAYVWKPRGHIQFSSIIPPEWDAGFVDGSINNYSTEYMLNKIKTINPEILVIAISSVVWNDDLKFVSAVRTAYPKLHIVAFGDALREKYFFDTMMEHVDEVILNPYLYDIENYKSKQFGTFKLIESLQGEKKGAEINTYSPRHHLFDSTAYRWPFVKHHRYAAVYTQFGCPYSCSYCTSSRTSVTFRSAENVLQEIDQLYVDGYKEIHFGDDTFGSPKKNARMILEGIKNRGYRFSWSAYTYPGLVDRKLMELMKSTGCHTLVIGIDSHNFDLLKEYGRPLTKELINEFIQNAKDLGIDVCGDFILGFEEEDEESILKTINLALNCGVDYASFNAANPLFATSIRDQKIESGIIKNDSFGWDTAGYTIAKSNKIDSERLKELRSIAVRKFYFRPNYVIRRLLKIRSLEEFSLRFIDGFGVLKNVLLTK